MINKAVGSSGLGRNTTDGGVDLIFAAVTLCGIISLGRGHSGNWSSVDCDRTDQKHKKADGYKEELVLKLHDELILAWEGVLIVNLLVNEKMVDGLTDGFYVVLYDGVGLGVGGDKL